MATEEKSKLGALVSTIVLAVVCIAGGWIACGLFSRGDGAGADAAAMRGMGPVTVAVTNVQMRAYNLPTRYVAHAEAVQEVDLLPQVDGYVKEIKFKEGDTVREGQLLYVLDDERYQAVVNQRKADLAAAEAEANRAVRYYQRTLKADERGITQLERDNAEAASEKAKAAVEQAKANLIVAEYDCKKAKVFAPISGQIGKTTAHIGDYVAPSKGALAHIMQIDPIRVTFPITDRAYVDWRSAQKAGEADNVRTRLLLPNGMLYSEEGRFDFDDNQMSRETATIILRLSFANPDRLLVPNSYLTLLADQRQPKTVACVPQQAIADLVGGDQGVYVLKDDQTVEQRLVTAGEPFEGWVPVKELQAGETVVVSGVAKLYPGAKVALVTATDNDDLNAAYEPPIKE